MRNEYCRTHACQNINKLVEEGCISKETGEELLRDQLFRLENDKVDLSSISVKALAPLRREQDPEIQQKVIALVAKGGERKEDLYGTERKMKALLGRFHDTDAHCPVPKHQNKADFAEECAAFWTKARKYWSEEVIEEVLDKARIGTR